MFPPIFTVCAADSAVQAALGSNPVRFVPFWSKTRPAKPYAVWQVIGGAPENYLGDVPDTDSWAVQVDVYADTLTEARTAAQALRDAIEPVAYITSWRGEDRDPTTDTYRYSFDTEWIAKRETTS